MCVLVIVLFILLVIFISFCNGWIMMEGLYVWFIFFIMIGFGDYVFFSEYKGNVGDEKVLIISLEWYSIFLMLFMMVGLSFVLCIFFIFVDLMDYICDFCDCCLGCCLNFIWFK